LRKLGNGGRCEFFRLEFRKMSVFLWVPLLVLGAVALVLLSTWLRGRQAESRDGAGDFDRLDTLAAWPPQATRILTTQERLAYSTLLRAFPDYMVLAQVPLSRFLKVPTRHSHAEWLRRVGHLCADLLVCDMASQVVAVIIVQSPEKRSCRHQLRRRRARRPLSRQARLRGKQFRYAGPCPRKPAQSPRPPGTTTSTRVPHR
jgi:hypothetical protein